MEVSRDLPRPPRVFQKFFRGFLYEILYLWGFLQEFCQRFFLDVSQGFQQNSFTCCSFYDFSRYFFRNFLCFFLGSFYKISPVALRGISSKTVPGNSINFLDLTQWERSKLLFRCFFLQVSRGVLTGIPPEINIDAFSKCLPKFFPAICLPRFPLEMIAGY